MASTTNAEPGARSSPPRAILEAVLGAGLAFAGVAHLTAARETFQAQVPDWFPVGKDLVVVVSGVVEVFLGAALLAVLLPALARWRVGVGLAVASFFVVVFPGNVAQFTEQRDAFGLDSDTARGVRLLFQPLLVVAALWSTGSWAPLVAAAQAVRGGKASQPAFSRLWEDERDEGRCQGESNDDGSDNTPSDCDVDDAQGRDDHDVRGE